MAHFDLFILIALAGLAWFWGDSSRAHQSGLQAARRVCQEEGLQLLDETVATRSLRLRRNDEGRISFLRIYEFEFTDTGNNRRRGSVHVLGWRVIMVSVGLRLVSSRDGLS